MLKGMDYPELEVRALFPPSGLADVSIGLRLFLAYFGPRFSQKWVQSQGFRPGQAMMLWKCLYGNNVWAHCPDELAGRSQFFFPFDEL
jgi:23S rRNA (adenine2503-C2)-methyltransferase